MELLIADECSLSWDKEVGYFIYGGIAVNEKDAKPLASSLLEIKTNRGIPRERPIKWNNITWEGVALDSELHKTIKDDVLTVFAESDARIIICMSPHQFYHDPSLKDDGSIRMSINPTDQLRSHEYGLNDLLAKFDRYVGEGNFGMVLADRFGDAVKDHMDKHCGDSFPHGPTRYHWRNIVHPVIQLENEDSHLHQINDVVLGAVYVSLREMGHNFLPRLRDNFWSADLGAGETIHGNGFNVYPQMPRFDWCRNANRKLKSKFDRLITEI